MLDCPRLRFGFHERDLIHESFILTFGGGDYMVDDPDTYNTGV